MILKWFNEFNCILIYLVVLFIIVLSGNCLIWVKIKKIINKFVGNNVFVIFLFVMVVLFKVFFIFVKLMFLFVKKIDKNILIVLFINDGNL